MSSYIVFGKSLRSCPSYVILPWDDVDNVKLTLIVRGMISELFSGTKGKRQSTPCTLSCLHGTKLQFFYFFAVSLSSSPITIVWNEYHKHRLWFLPLPFPWRENQQKYKYILNKCYFEKYFIFNSSEDNRPEKREKKKLGTGKTRNIWVFYNRIWTQRNSTLFFKALEFRSWLVEQRQLTSSAAELIFLQSHSIPLVFLCNWNFIALF